MKLKPIQAAPFLLLIGIFIFSACQVIKAAPLVTVQPTKFGETPPAQKAAGNKPLPPTFTPTGAATSTPAIAPYLSAEPGQFNGLRIEFWHPWGGDTAGAMAGLVEEYNRVNPWGIRVNASSYYSAGALFDAVQSGLAQDSLVLPDLVAAPEEQLSEWAEKGLLLPLEEYIALPELGLDEPFYPQYVQQNQHDGQVVGIPALRSANVIFYNRTWAEELGFSHPPTTPLEFKEQACKAAVANNTSKTLEKFGTGGWLIDTDALTILSWLDAFGAHPLPTSARSKYVFESRESQEAFAFLRGMLDDGCAWLRRSQTPDDYFSRRLALFYTGTAPDMLEQKRANGLAKSQDEWIVLPYPRKNGGSMIYSNGYSLAVLDPSNRSASEETQRKQMAAWLFIRWVSQPENQTALAKNFPSLPVSSAEADLLEKEKNSFPWNLLLPLNDVAQPAPALPTWRAVRRLVEDAGWQVFHLPADQVAGILPELDAGIQEMIR